MVSATIRKILLRSGPRISAQRISDAIKNVRGNVAFYNLAGLCTSADEYFAPVQLSGHASDGCLSDSLFVFDCPADCK